jgi:methionine aminopeptidase
MAITLKSAQDLEGMRVAGQLAAEVLAMLKEHVKPGVTTEDLDRLAYEHIVNVQKAIPANVGYHGFPKTLCTSVNHVICHGIPSPGKCSRTATSSISTSPSSKTAGMATPAACTSSARLACSPSVWSTPPTKR